MSINLVTYANQTVTPTNDAIIYERAIDQNGIFHGCNVTVSGNAVNITGGYGMVCGREFVIESESIPVTLAPSGTNDGRLYVRLDLADLDAPIQLLTDQGNPLPSLEQDTDVNYVNGAYEMELATFTVGVSALSDCVETFTTIAGTNTLINNTMIELRSLIWTNPSPTTDFAAQTISVANIDNYDYFEVLFKRWSTEGASFYEATPFRVIPDYSANCIQPTNVTISGTITFIARTVTITSSGISIGAGKSKGHTATGDPTTVNGAMIPFKIYGVKKFS